MGKTYDNPIAPDEIRAVRKLVGMNQSEFETMIGVASPSVSRWERGAGSPNKTAERMIRIIGAHPELADEIMGDVSVVLERSRGMYRSGGYVYTNMAHDDAMLGRAVRAVFKSLGTLDADDQEALRHSVQHYLTYGIIEMPEYSRDVPTMDDLPRAPVALFKQFLMACGEDPAAVETVMREQWDEMMEGIGGNQ